MPNLRTLQCVALVFFALALCGITVRAGEPCVRPGTPDAATAPASQLCPPCQPLSGRTSGSRRIRREIRSLSASQLERVVDAFHVMKSTEQEVGEQLYGPLFKQWDYFVAKHAVTATDSRGDQGHFSAAFMTWHSAFVFEFENSLVAVDPEIDGLPYWDSTIRSPSVFSPSLFGSAPGTGPGFEVVDGLFANFPIEDNFSLQDYSEYFDNEETVAFESSDTGLLRDKGNELDTTVVTRFGGEFYYEAQDFDTCRNLQGPGLGWEQWYECIELGTVNQLPRVQGNDILLSFTHHSGPHIWIGGTSNEVDFSAIMSVPEVLAQVDTMGDFMDVVTSPNEPLFMLHHANLDRSKMWWMRNNEELAPTYWNFPASGSRSVPLGEEYEGINLNEQMATAWGFSPKLFGWSDSETLLTHADALCNFSPRDAPYIYDDMIESPVSPIPSVSSYSSSAASGTSSCVVFSLVLTLVGVCYAHVL